MRPLKLSVFQVLRLQQLEQELQEVNEEYSAALNRASQSRLHLHQTIPAGDQLIVVEVLHAQVSEVLREILSTPELPLPTEHNKFVP